MSGYTEEGLITHFDGTAKIGGGSHPSPMQTVAMALGSCSAIDVISILQKQRQELLDIHIDIDAQRDTSATPSLFTHIHLHFHLYGELTEKKVQQALTLSVDKYCSVGLTLKKAGVDISYDYTIH